jgi:hypothetical protein
VGGWQRLWANSSDASAFGGPKASSFGSFTQTSARQFVYGPGAGGMIVEYLFSNPGGEKYLLSRAASVSNLGDRYFQLDFNKALQAYELEEEGKTKANKACFQVDPGDPNCLFTGLKSQTPVQLSGAPTTPPAPGLVFQTTYLSERLWIVRNEQGDKVAAFLRSPGESVMDRRGLVLENQLNPSKNESVRYGSLLFGESQEEYSGWESKTGKEEATKDKLLR